MHINFFHLSNPSAGNLQSGAVASDGASAHDIDFAGVFVVLDKAMVAQMSITAGKPQDTATNRDDGRAESAAFSAKDTDQTKPAVTEDGAMVVEMPVQLAWRTEPKALIEHDKPDQTSVPAPVPRYESVPSFIPTETAKRPLDEGQKPLSAFRNNDTERMAEDDTNLGRSIPVPGPREHDPTSDMTDGFSSETQNIQVVDPSPQPAETTIKPKVDAPADGSAELPLRRQNGALVKGTPLAAYSGLNGLLGHPPQSSEMLTDAGIGQGQIGTHGLAAGSPRMDQTAMVSEPVAGPGPATAGPRETVIVPRVEGSFVAAFQLHVTNRPEGEVIPTTPQTGQNTNTATQETLLSADQMATQVIALTEAPRLRPRSLGTVDAKRQDAHPLPNTPKPFNATPEPSRIKPEVAVNDLRIDSDPLPQDSGSSEGVGIFKALGESVGASKDRQGLVAAIGLRATDQPLPQNRGALPPEAEPKSAMPHDPRAESPQPSLPSQALVPDKSEMLLRPEVAITEDQSPVASVGISGTQSTSAQVATASTPQIAPVLNQVAQGLHALIQRDATDQLNLTLNPEELGRLRFEMTTMGEKLHITVFVERGDTMDLLRRHADHLLNDLRQSGLGQTSLSFGNWSQGGQAKPDRTTQSEYADPTEASSPTPTFAALRHNAADGRLDLRL